jgi:hypothetical protein
MSMSPWVKTAFLLLVLGAPIVAAPGCGSEPELPPVQVSEESPPPAATRKGVRKIPPKAPTRLPAEK